MYKKIPNLIFTVLLSMGIVVGRERTTSIPSRKATSAGPMQVDEPSVKIAPKPKAKVAKVKPVPTRGLTAEQKKAFRVRKYKMHTMMNLITEKRRALQAAKPEARAALARELHSMILEREPTAATITAHSRLPNQESKIGNAPELPPKIEAINTSAE